MAGNNFGHPRELLMAYFHEVDRMLEKNALRINALKRAQTKLFDAFNAAYNGHDATARDLVNHANEIIDNIEKV